MVVSGGVGMTGQRACVMVSVSSLVQSVRRGVIGFHIGQSLQVLHNVQSLYRCGHGGRKVCLGPVI